MQTGVHRLGLSLNYFSNSQFDLALSEALSRLGNLNITHCYVARAISLVRLGGEREEAREAIARILDINPHYGRAALHEFGGNNLAAGAGPRDQVCVEGCRLGVGAGRCSIGSGSLDWNRAFCVPQSR